jgi:hypothetical protein
VTPKGKTTVTLTIELTPEQEAALQAAGIDATEYVQDLIDAALPLPAPPVLPLARLTALASERALSRIWDTPEEDAAWAHL